MNSYCFACVLKDCQLPDGLAAHLRYDAERRSYYVQVQGMRPCVMTGETVLQKGGKRYLSPHMVESELVRLVFGATQAFQEHELREGFTYKGKRVFGPHISMAALLEAANDVEMRVA